jgi:hypothetical protein
LLRGRDLKRWRIDSQDLWIVFTRRGCDIANYPGIQEHLKHWKNQLMPGVVGGRKQGSYEWYEIQDNVAYWEGFELPGKIVFPDIADSCQFTWDTGRHYIANTGYALGAPRWLLAAINSNIALWFYRQISNSIRGGYLRFIRQYVEQIPIPDATQQQQRLCERLVDVVIWLNSPGQIIKSGGNAPGSLMAAYFEQWLNGLVYELFFKDELHARNLRIFDETAKLDPPALEELSDTQKLTRLDELFKQAYDLNAPLRSMLFSLPSLESVRIIEESA